MNRGGGLNPPQPADNSNPVFMSDNSVLVYASQGHYYKKTLLFELHLL